MMTGIVILVAQLRVIRHPSPGSIRSITATSGGRTGLRSARSPSSALTSMPARRR
jgi:hypothetical protein